MSISALGLYHLQMASGLTLAHDLSDEWRSGVVLLGGGSRGPVPP